MGSYLTISVAVGVLALAVAMFLSNSIGNASAGNDRMKEIAGYIHEGAMAFLYAEYKYLAIFVAIVAVVIGVCLSPMTAVCFVAGYSVAVFTSTFKMSMWLGLLVGAVIGVVFALLLSFILFRMRGMYFAVATWLIAEAVRLWFNSWRFVKQGAGMTIATSQIPKVRELYIYALTLCIIALVVVYLLLRTKTGLGLTAMRDDADASSSVGVNIFKSKLLCYLICSLFIALAGGMFALQKGSVLPSSSFSIDWTVAMVFIVIIGGVGTMAGPILGGIIYVVLSEILAHFPGWSISFVRCGLPIATTIL